MTTVAFRTDASIAIGMGHVMRCITLADELARRGARCRFVMREHQGNLSSQVRSRGHEVHMLPPPRPNWSPPEDVTVHQTWLGAGWEADAAETGALLEGDAGVDWLVTDHYAIDARWESALRPLVRRVLGIDDLADRHHDVDLLVDQNLGHFVEDYARLVPPQAMVLTGTEYALLRAEFAELRAVSLARRATPILRRILVSLGGVDRENVTGRVLEALARTGLPPGCSVVVVMGVHAPWLDDVRRQASLLPLQAEIRHDVNDMATLMVAADVAIGAGGSSAWERCCLGLPTVLLMLAENQRANCVALTEAGAASYVDATSLAEADFSRWFSLDWMASASRRAATLVDGRGTARVAAQMLEMVT